MTGYVKQNSGPAAYFEQGHGVPGKYQGIPNFLFGPSQVVRLVLNVDLCNNGRLVIVEAYLPHRPG